MRTGLSWGGFGLLLGESSAVVSGGDSLNNLLLYVFDPFPSFIGTFSIFRGVVEGYGECNVVAVIAVLVFLFFISIFVW